MHTRRGFTLIELSIVLVIIGLIIGGVLVGRDLIASAQVRSIVSQMENFQTAVNTFKLKYNCAPGDCAQATSLGLGPNGNGDGFVGSISDMSDPISGGCLTTPSTADCFTTKSSSPSGTAYQIGRGYGEIQRFWLHLSNAQLIPNSITALAHADVDISASLNLYWPKDALGKAYLEIVPWNSKLYIRTGFDSVYSIYTTPTSQTTVLTAGQMNSIASKFNYPIITTSTGGYPDALAQGQKMVPLGIHAAIGNDRYTFIAPTTANPVARFTACAVSDGAGGYKYNVANNGSCNMLWQIDY